MKVIANLIKEAVKVDDFTVDLVTPQPDPILPLQLEIFMIMDKEWSEEHGSTKATNISGGDEGNYANLHANGTGPYMVKDRQPDVRTDLVANHHWWGDNKSKVTDGIFTHITQDEKRADASIPGVDATT